MSTPIAAIRKNGREEARISIDEYRGHRLLNLRMWSEADNGEMHPGKEGLALRLDILPEMRAALEQVDREVG